MAWVYILIAVIVVIVIVIVILLAKTYTQKEEPYIQETKDYIQNFKLDSTKLDSIKPDNIDAEKASKLIEKVSLKVKDKDAIKITTLDLEILEGRILNLIAVDNFYDASIRNDKSYGSISSHSSYGSGSMAGQSLEVMEGFITENKPDTELDFILLKDILGEQPKQLLFKKDWSLVDISYINEEAEQKLEERKKELLSKFSDMNKDKATKFKEELNDYAKVCITKHEICYYHKPTHLLIKINYEI